MLHRSMHQDITRIKETMNAPGKENRLSENARKCSYCTMEFGRHKCLFELLNYEKHIRRTTRYNNVFYQIGFSTIKKFENERTTLQKEKNINLTVNLKPQDLNANKIQRTASTTKKE